MNNFDDIDLMECPLCQGPAILEEESGWCMYVACGDCGAHTAEFEFKSEKDKHEAAKKAAKVWNMGKVVRSDPGE